MSLKRSSIMDARSMPACAAASRVGWVRSLVHTSSGTSPPTVTAHLCQVVPLVV